MEGSLQPRQYYCFCFERVFRMKKISHILSIYEKTMGTIALLAMLMLVFYQVLARFIFGSQLRWSEELARYLMLYISFVGIGAGIMYHKHVGVDVLGNFLDPAGKRILKLIVAFITLAIIIFFTYISGAVTLKIFKSGQVSPASHIPMWIPYGTIPLGFFGGILRQIEEIVKIIKTPGEQLFIKEQQEKAEIAEV